MASTPSLRLRDAHSHLQPLRKAPAHPRPPLPRPLQPPRHRRQAARMPPSARVPRLGEVPANQVGPPLRCLLASRGLHKGVITCSEPAGGRERSECERGVRTGEQLLQPKTLLALLIIDFVHWQPPRAIAHLAARAALQQRLRRVCTVLADSIVQRGGPIDCCGVWLCTVSNKQPHLTRNGWLSLFKQGSSHESKHFAPSLHYPERRPSGEGLWSVLPCSEPSSQQVKQVNEFKFVRFILFTLIIENNSISMLSYRASTVL